MSEEWGAPRPPSKSRRWLRWLAWSAAGLLVLLLGVYFIGTSAVFVKSFVLPRVSEAVNATVTVSDTSVSPFFKVVLRDVKLQTSPTEEPLLTVREVRARYSLLDILHGRIHVDEVTLDGPVIHIIQYANGTTSLDPLLKSSPSPAKPKPEGATSSPPPALDVKSVTLTNGTVRLVKFHADGSDVVELSNLNITLSDLVNEGTPSLGLAGEIKLDRKLATADPNTPSQLLGVRLAGGFEATLGADLKPRSAKGKLSLEITQAQGEFQPLSGLQAALNCDLSPTEVRQLSFAFTQQGKTLGRLSVSGPFALDQTEGHLKVELSDIDRQVLNLAGAPLGLDFGGTTLNAAQDITLEKHGQSIRVNGSITAGQLSVTQKGATTHPLDLRTEYQVALDRVEQTALIQAFSLNATQDKQPLLTAALSQPMKLSFGQATNAVEESALDLSVTNLNLADWKAFLGDYAGKMQLQLHLLAQEAGKKLSAQMTSRLEDFSAVFGSNRVENATLALSFRGGANDFHAIRIEQLGVSLSRQNQAVLDVSGAGQVDTRIQEVDFDAKIEAALDRVAAWVALPEAKATSGKLALETKLVRKLSETASPGSTNFDQSIRGTLRLDQLTGNYAGSRFEQFDASLDFAAALKGPWAELDKLSGSLKQKGQPGGAFEASGRYHLTNHTGQGQLKLSDLNQNVLRSLLAGTLGPRTLESVSISLDASARYDPAAESSVQGDFQVRNFLILDPGKPMPKVPMTAEVKLDAGLRNDLAEIRQCAGQVRQGTEDAGRFEATGSYDLKKQAGQLALKLVDLNQHALRPFLASALGDRTLNSVSINAVTTARYDAKGESGVAGEINIANLLITDPKNTLPKSPLAAQLKVNGSLLNQSAEIRQLSGVVQLGSLPSGTFSASGRYHLTNQTGQLTLQLTDLNQNALTPFLQPALGDKKLTSVSINAEASASYDPKAASSVKTRVSVNNLLVEDPAGKLPKTPLEFSLDLNGSIARQLLTLDQFQVSLSPTDRARNQLSLAGKVDLARSNAISGDLQLTAESLDLTPYYDLYTATRGPAPSAQSKPAGSPVPRAGTPKPTPEPAPVSLPFRQFTCGLNIGKLYLREIAIANWQASVRLDGGQVLLKPFQLVLNGAPVTALADLDLAKPGYQYDLTLGAEKVPLEPIVNTFSPEQRGQMKADVMASAQVRGQGITGASLQRNLNGHLGFSLTNANIQIASPRLNSFLTPIALLLGAPDLLNSPLNWIGAKAEMGGGKVQLNPFNLASDTFTADTQGDLRLSEVLADSPFNKWPMHFYLRRALAQRIRMVPKNTPPDAEFVKLPDFIQVAGTLGEPKAELNKLALTGSLLESVTDRIPGLKEKTGGLNPLDLFKRPK